MHIISRTTICLFAISLAPVFAQDSTTHRALQFGISAGVPITDPFQTGSFFTLDFGEGTSSATRRYTIGPRVELKLPHGFGIELDALYKRLGFAETIKSNAVQYTYSQTRANSWEFPLLVKYRLPIRRMRHPFVDVGPAFRTNSGVSSSSMSFIDFGNYAVQPPVQRSSSSEPHLSNRSNAGVVVGLGLAFRLGPLHISPEGRYTRWRTDRYPDVLLCSNQNQADFLLGLTF